MGIEAQLRESERRLATLLSNLPGMAYRCRDDAEWTMEFVSEGCLLLTGYTASELLANQVISYEQVIHPEDRARVRAEVEASLAASKSFYITYRIVTKDGELRWVSEQGREAAQGTLEGIVSDITLHRRAEQALAEKEQLLRAIIDHSFQFVGLLDIEGRLLRPNQTALDAVGASMEEVRGRAFWETPWWAHSSAEQERLKAAIARAAQGEFVRYETTHPTRDGRLLYFDFSLTPVRDADGRVVALVPEGRDITEQKQIEQALRQSEEKFAKAFRASPFSLTISEVQSGRYLDINAGFERLSGYTRDEVIGRTSLELGLWQDLAVRDELVRRLGKDGFVRGMEVNFLSKGGDVCVTRCSAELVELGGQTCILNAVEDITSQRQAEESKRALEAQLRGVQKLEALGQLAGGIAHDFNNILSGVVSFTELALLDAHEPTAVREHLAEVQSAVGRAAELVRQILTFSRQQKQERRPIRLHSTLREALKLLRSSLPQTIEMEAFVSSTAPTVLADSTQVHQLVMNLCTNAAHAMRERPGRLSVRLEAAEVDAALARATPALRPGTYARLSVADTGQGMDARTLQRIFEPFFTTKASGEGTGLGLSVVHGIVEEHDAVITVDSKPGEGSTFRVFFPEHCELVSEDESETPALPKGAGERILFVDDEQMICRSAEILLGRLGYRVTTHVDPARALSAFRAAPDAVDLVITDMTMPRITGIEVARQVLAVRPQLPVLLTSGYTGSWTLEGVRAHGLSGLIAKPLAAGPLLEAIRAALAERS